MAPLWNDILSVFPQTSPATALLPDIGTTLPLDGELKVFTSGHPSVVACVRHCGCPFAEKEVKELANLSNKHSSLRVVIVCMAEEAIAKDWFQEIGADQFQDQARVLLYPDPSRETYAALGIGQLSWGSLFTKTVMSGVQELKEKENIVNRETRAGSNRWQNSGGFAIDSQGTVKWRHLALDASDMCDYRGAVATLDP